MLTLSRAQMHGTNSGVIQNFTFLWVLLHVNPCSQTRNSSGLSGTAKMELSEVLFHTGMMVHSPYTNSRISSSTERKNASSANASVTVD